MKYLKLSNIIAVILFLMLTACTDFLTENSKSELGTGTFFNSDAEAKLAVNGIYRLFHSPNLYRDVGIDRFYLDCADEVGANRSEDGEIFNYAYNETSLFIYNTYKELYAVARNCALFMESIENNPKLSDSFKKQAVGEILFLRALTYWHLTNIWGDVPYFRKLPTITELATIKRTDKKIIRKEMEDDLARAFDLLPASYPSTDLGRATKWAAAALRAKYYMMENNWQGMLDECKKVIASPNHKLLPNFADVFNQKDPTKQYNDEIIFAIDFHGVGSVEADFQSTRVNHYNPRVVKDEPKDQTKLKAFQAMLASRNEEMNGYGKAIPLPELARRENWEAGDLRYDETIITSYQGFELKFPYFKKMWNLDKTYSPRSLSANNNVVFRLADIYLMAAEAENELNGPTNAYQYVNKVRERAFEPDKPWSGLTKEQFRLKLRDERKFELCGEAYRRLDLVRWGILVETVKKTEYRSFNNPQDNITAKHYLYPFPEEEVLLNPAILETDPTNNGWR